MREVCKFITGFNSFRDEYFCRENSPFNKLRKTQTPSTMVIACSDSRTDPSLIMQCEPGEIFVVRNIANIVPPYESDTGHHGVSAAIEYAVKSLNVSDIIILGHSCCGGIRALMTENDESKNKLEFVNKWLSVLEPVRERVLSHFHSTTDKSCIACEMAGILHSMENLMTFPWIAERVKDGELDLHGWYFNMETGQLLSYLQQTKSFEPLTSICPKDGANNVTPEGK